MKSHTAPQCPRCNSSLAVRQLVDGTQPQEISAVRQGYSLAGRCIRPENSEWYCNACAESFAVAREHWGDPQTERIQ